MWPACRLCESASYFGTISFLLWLGSAVGCPLVPWPERDDCELHFYCSSKLLLLKLYLATRKRYRIELSCENISIDWHFECTVCSAPRQWQWDDSITKVGRRTAIKISIKRNYRSFSPWVPIRQWFVWLSETMTHSSHARCVHCPVQSIKTILFAVVSIADM